MPIKWAYICLRKAGNKVTKYKGATAISEFDFITVTICL